MITLRDIELRYGSRCILTKTNVTFGRGEIVALVGCNGAGKSTLLRAIAAIDRLAAGDVLYGGQSVRNLAPAEVARRVAFVGTNRVRVANLRVEDVVAIGRAPYTNWFGRMQAVDCEAVGAALRAVGMEAFARRTMDSLSDGECQRVMIARAVAQATPAILLDEPTAFLDIPTRFEVCRLLARLAHDEGRTIVFSTHDLDSALEVCDSVAVVDNATLTKYSASAPATTVFLDNLFRR